jgi:hypothetical protein
MTDDPHDMLPAELDPEVEHRIATLPTNERMKAALRLVAAGVDYRRAAEALGYQSQKDLHGWAKRAGLLEIHSERLVAGYKRIGQLSNQEIERRLEEAPEDVSIKDLAVVAGIASDKIAKYERWGLSERENTGTDRFGALVERIMAAGGATVSLSIEPHQQAIDVTPEEE